MKKYKNRGSKKLIIVLACILTISLGFALLSTTLNINGLINIKTNSWDIHLENLSVTPGSVDAANPAEIGDDNKSVEFSANFQDIGDFYEFTVKAVNDGTVDGTIDDIEFKYYDVEDPTVEIDSEDVPNYVSTSVTLNNTPLEKNHVLEAEEEETYKIRVEYTDNLLEEKDVNSNFNCIMKIIIKYKQKKKTT